MAEGCNFGTFGILSLYVVLRDSLWIFHHPLLFIQHGINIKFFCKILWIFSILTLSNSYVIRNVS